MLPQQFLKAKQNGFQLKKVILVSTPFNDMHLKTCLNSKWYNEGIVQ